MNIEKALQHLEWKFRNTWKPTVKDIDAFNSVIQWKELQEQRTLNRNESLAKLWIEKMLLLNRTNMYSGERSIQVIDEILSKSVYECCLVLKNEIPMMRFNSVLSKYGAEYYNNNLDALNRTTREEANSKVIAEHETELTEALKYEISEDNIIKFVQKEINRIINKFEK